MPLEVVSAASPASNESEELEALRGGQITLDEFLDRKASRAVVKLRGKLSDEQVAAVRDAIRVQLETDPGTRELVRRLTGQDPFGPTY